MPFKTLMTSAAIALATTAALSAIPAAAQGEPTYSSNYGNDRAEIEDLMARYLFAIDYFDWDAYVSVFAEDAELEYATGITRGREAIRIEGDRAWGRTLWVEMANNGPGDAMKMGTYGIYEDEFRRIDGRWLIQRRNVLNEFLNGRNSGPNNPVAEMDAAADAYAASVAAIR